MLRCLPLCRAESYRRIGKIGHSYPSFIFGPAYLCRMKALMTFLLFCPLWLAAQLRPIEIADIHRWKNIEKQIISSDGQWVAYSIKPVSEGDATLLLWNALTATTVAFPRGESPAFSEDGAFLAFTIKPALDTLRALKRKKTKTDDLPKDSLGIYRLADGSLEKIGRVRSWTMPEHWSGWMAIQLEPALVPKTAAPPKDSLPTAVLDSLKTLAEKLAKTKKESTANGTALLLRHLASQRTDTFPFVLEYTLAKRAPVLLLGTTGIGDAPMWQHKKDIAQAGVYARALEATKVHSLWRGKGKWKQLALDEKGIQAAFLLDNDTTKAFIRPWQLRWAMTNVDTSHAIAENGNPFLPTQPATATRKGQWIISDNAPPVFSKDGSRLFFGIAPPPVVPDTISLAEELAKVEVWATSSSLLHTQMNARQKNDLKRYWPAVCLLDQKQRTIALADPAHPELRVTTDKDRIGEWALGIDEEPGMPASQWLGAAGKDIYAVHLISQQKKLLQRNVPGAVSLSPTAKHILWWSVADSSWWVQPLKKSTAERLTDNRQVPFFKETEDTPDFPDPHGNAGWLTDDEGILIYDQYDIWLCAPGSAPRRLTNGRSSKTVYRYIHLDTETAVISGKTPLLLHTFNQNTKREGYIWYDLATGRQSTWMEGPFSLSRSPLKAKKAEKMVYTAQDLATFPDLRYTEMTPFGTSAPSKRISDVNPQQKEYAWPTVEMVQWMSLSGDSLSGLLFKPAGFSADKKYPMIVYFYEKLSDGLYQHRAPGFHRSSINPTVYASRGYVVFIPDIPYRIGYPGESAFNAVVSGTQAMMDMGGIDPKRVALQGHSWGGYQAAYIVTRTNMFRCAEAGAAVVNMTSAYGGIRWESGANRNFQYERQQSRIGGTLWDKPWLFIENSPLFSLNKVETPLLLMHNDKDGAVPWEQGLEFFTGLRRLGKPAWLLNYNDEPHWPVKLPNRIDFQKRMQQFFDYYLMDRPMPRWMEKGIPPLESGLKEE